MPKDITQRFPGFEKFITFGTYYQKRYNKSDNLSNSVLNLKSGDDYAIQKWGEYLIEIIPSLGPKKTTNAIWNMGHLVRALGHKELRCDEAHPLSRVKNILKESPLLVDKCNRLSKSKETQPLKFLTREQKEQELQNIYSFFARENEAMPWAIIIFDDIVTTGNTIKAIASAIKESLPNARLYGFTLLETYNPNQPQTFDNDKVYHDIFIDDGIPDLVKASKESDKYKLFKSFMDSLDYEWDPDYVEYYYEKHLYTVLQFNDLNDLSNPLLVYQGGDSKNDVDEDEDLPF